MQGVGTQGAEALWLSTTHPGTRGSEQNLVSCQKTASPPESLAGEKSFLKWCFLGQSLFSHH